MKNDLFGENHLNTFDVLLGGSKNRGDIVELPLEKLKTFANHPFRVEDDEEMALLVESIKEKGVINPVLLRQIPDEKYEIISGHRRKRACELAGIKTIPAIVRDLTDDEATILMVDSNLHREHILPSERAFALKMKMEAIKNQGFRSDLTSGLLVQKLNREEIEKNERRKLIDKFKVRDNNAEHSIQYEFMDADGNPDGSIYIEALAANPDVQDSFNCNIAIADEIHAFKKAAQYNRFKEAMKAYSNKLMIGITTAGDNMNSFCYRRLDYAVKVVSDVVKDDSLFAFISRADQDENGDVDYTNPEQHEKANPSYGVTIRPEDILQESLQAQNDPQQRKDFLSRSLNIYTTAMKAYFNIDEFRNSDAQYDWSIEELAKLPIKWYGGADLSRLHDLTAAALFGHYDKENVDIIITHAFFPVVNAAKKADEDGIPLFGWKDDGWLTMSNTPTTEVSDVVKWFKEMKKKGFNIRQIGHDRKFAREYFIAMKKAGFNIIDQPQYYYLKSEGFRHIEKAVKDKRMYYVHSDAYEYCVQNVRAIEKSDDMIQFEKIQPEQRIDLFDASVFACVRYLNDLEKSQKARGWFDE